MKVKSMVVVALAGLMMLSLAACGGSNKNVEYSADEPLVIKVSHPDSESNVHQKSFEAFKDYVETETDGVVQVEIHANGVLGGDQEVMQMVAMNEVQIAECGTSVFSTIDDKFGIMDLPFLFTSYEAMDEAVTGGLGDMYNEWLEESGLYGLAFMWDGCKTVSNNVRPIKTLDDMDGLKIRITDADLYQLSYRAMGANPTPMGWGDIYSGLQQGVVDGMDVPAISTYSNGWHESLEYWSLMNNHWSNCIVYTSQTFMDGLPDDIRAVIEEGADIYLQQQDRENARQAELDSIEAMKKEGVQVDEVKDIDEFIKAVEPVYEYYRDLLGDKVMDEVESYKK